MKTNRILLSIFLLLLILVSNPLLAGYRYTDLRGDGNVVRQTRNVTGFIGLDISGAFEVYLKQGGSESVAVEADDNLQPLIKTELRGTTLKIYIDKPIHHPTTMKVYITVKELREIEVSGAVDIFTESKLTLNELEFEASGASETKMDIEVQKLNLDCSGASKLRFSGSAGTVHADVSGACDIFAFDLATKDFILSLSGAGSAEVNVTGKIQAEISGAGNLRYKGNPVEVDQQVSGAGSIRKVQ